MKFVSIVASALCALMVLPSVHACEFHGGGFGGAFGSQWRPYNPDADTYDSSSYGDETDDAAAAETTEKARPVFANSAARAAKSAKIQVAEGDADSESAEDSDSSSQE